MTDTNEMLMRLSMMCARNIEKFGDLSPIEIEATMRAMDAERDRLVERIERLRQAVENPGRMPAWHHRIMERHRREWPTLWNAIDRLLVL